MLNLERVIPHFLIQILKTYIYKIIIHSHHKKSILEVFQINRSGPINQILPKYPEYRHYNHQFVMGFTCIIRDRDSFHNSKGRQIGVRYETNSEFH